MSLEKIDKQICIALEQDCMLFVHSPKLAQILIKSNINLNLQSIHLQVRNQILIDWLIDWLIEWTLYSSIIE